MSLEVSIIESLEEDKLPSVDKVLRLLQYVLSFQCLQHVDDVGGALQDLRETWNAMSSPDLRLNKFCRAWTCQNNVHDLNALPVADGSSDGTEECVQVKA